MLSRGPAGGGEGAGGPPPPSLWSVSCLAAPTEPSPTLGALPCALGLDLAGIILGTHHEKGAFTFWSYAIGLPLPSSAILSWKFCHVLHKVLRDGHPNVSSCHPLVQGPWPSFCRPHPREHRRAAASEMSVGPSASLGPSALGWPPVLPLPSVCPASREQVSALPLEGTGSFILPPLSPPRGRCYTTASGTGATFGRSETCG